MLGPSVAADIAQALTGGDSGAQAASAAGPVPGMNGMPNMGGGMNMNMGGMQMPGMGMGMPGMMGMGGGGMPNMGSANV